MANPVYFIAEVTNGVDANEAKSRLEQLANDITVTSVLDAIGTIMAETSQGTYESQFGAQLSYHAGQWSERELP